MNSVAWLRNKYLILPALILSAGIFFFIWNSGPVPAIYWKKGARQSYQLSVNTVILAKQPGLKPLHERIEIRGKLHLRIYEVLANKIRVGFQLSPVSIMNSGRESELAARVYSKIFFAEFSVQGRFLNFSFANELSKEDETSLQDLMTSFQYVMARPRFQGWGTEEKDRFGIYQAQYKLNGNLIHKSKKSYLGLNKQNLSGAADSQVQILQSNLVIKFGEPKSWLKSVSGKELLLFKSSEKSILKVSNVFDLRSIAWEENPELEIWHEQRKINDYLTEWKGKPKNKVSLFTQTDKAKLQEKFGNQNFFQMADKLFARYKGFNVACLRDLIDYLRIYPQSAGNYLDYLIKDQLNPAQRVMLVHALERAGHLEAQSALVTIMSESRFKFESRRQAVIGLGSLPNPARESVASLFKIYYNPDLNDPYSAKLGNIAILSLGAISKNLAENSAEDAKERAGEIKKQISAELASGKEMGKTIALLHGAGNTRDENFIPEITRFFQDNNPLVRASAVSSLGHMPEPRVNELLAGELDNQTNVNVRKSIVTTLFANEPDEKTVKKIISKLPAEDNDLVRGEMYRYLLKNRDFPGVQDVLRQMLNKEEKMVNRKIIYRALYTGKKIDRKGVSATN